MKKMISLCSLMLLSTLLFVFTACGNGSVTENNSLHSDPQSDSKVNEPDTISTGSLSVSPDETEARSLVVYFSCTGNTESVAKAIAAAKGADLYEIVPEQPYTTEDLNYNNRSSRSTAEQNDSSARPAISGTIQNLEQYDTVYVGYPIWWGDMPRILYTFFDTYDLSGKTIAPFCTSGGSGLSGTPDRIRQLEPNASVVNGLHISDSKADQPEPDLTQWLASIGQSE